MILVRLPFVADRLPGCRPLYSIACCHFGRVTFAGRSVHSFYRGAAFALYVAHCHRPLSAVRPLGKICTVRPVPIAGKLGYQVALGSRLIIGRILAI